MSEVADHVEVECADHVALADTEKDHAASEERSVFFLREEGNEVRGLWR